MQIHQDVKSIPEQSNHHWVHADIQQCHLPRPGFNSHQCGGIPLYLHSTCLVAHGWFLLSIWFNVFQDMACSFYLHRCQAQQKGQSVFKGICSSDEFIQILINILLKSKIEDDPWNATGLSRYEILFHYRGRAKNEIFEKKIIRN